MTPEEWQKVRAILESALELDCANRPAFLSEACADPSLRLEIESLIDAHEQADASVLNSLPVSGSGIAIEGTDDAMIGRHLGVYELARRIGQGGMAAVFLAYRADGEFHRQVAIKLVLPGLDSNEVVNRFRKERQTLAGLDHPNIVKLLDGGSTPEGLPYLVLDYVEGSPIDEYCDSHKLSIEQRLRLFGKVCEALQHAHQKLVIHRDLKPSNILVTADGIPKLLDFGIAKVLEPAARLWALTQTGARCMTPGYASPEQVRGKSVTTATDIYSLGVVLYELLTGHRPYRLKEYTTSEIERAICEQEPENPSTAVMRARSEASSDGTRVSKTPEMVSQTREGQPERLRRLLQGDLDNILLKALQKEPERRYNSVEEFARDIDRHLRHLPVKARRSTLIYRASRFIERHKIEASITSVLVLVLVAAVWLTLPVLSLRSRITGSPSMPIQSLAVLPLVNLSGDPSQEYFSEGITDALTTDLAQIGSLRVISRTSAVQFKGSKETLPQIGRDLNVDAIVEGTVSRAEGHVRITAQLIEANSDHHLWARSYERDLKDVLTLQDEVARDIAEEIRIKLTPKERTLLTEAHPVSPEAHDDYLRGRFWWSKRTAEGEWKGLDYFQKAVAKDPNYALGYAGVADSYLVLGHHGRLTPKEAFPKAKIAAMKALELDDSLAEARTSLALIEHSYDGDWSSAESDFKRAIALNPNYATAHHWYSHYLVSMGRLDEAVTELERARDLDPFSIPINSFLGIALYYARRYDDAILQFRRASEMHPELPGRHDEIAEVYEQQNRLAEAFAERQQSLRLNGDTQLAASLEQVYQHSGYKGYLAALIQSQERALKPGSVDNMYFAHLYAILGDQTHALHYLERAYDERNPWLLNVQVDPAMDSLRSSPAFRDLIRRIGLPLSQP